MAPFRSCAIKYPFTMASVRAFLRFIGLLWVCGLAAAPYVGRCRVAPDTSGHDVWLVRHGWHAGVTLRLSDLNDFRWPGRETRAGARYVEVGWGDAAYYTDPSPGLWALLRAGLWPTPSVLHVTALPHPPDVYFPESEIIRLRITRSGLDSLLEMVANEYLLDEGRIQPVARALYGDGWFYEARGTYHLFNNCNHWVARLLRTAGLPMASSLTVGGLMAQARRIGAVVRRSDGAASTVHSRADPMPVIQSKSRSNDERRSRTEILPAGNRCGGRH